MISEHSGIKDDITNKIPKYFVIKQHISNNTWIKEVSSEIKKYFEPNERIRFLVYVFDQEWDGRESWFSLFSKDLFPDDKTNIYILKKIWKSIKKNYP